MADALEDSVLDLPALVSCLTNLLQGQLQIRGHDPADHSAVTFALGVGLGELHHLHRIGGKTVEGFAQLPATASLAIPTAELLIASEVLEQVGGVGSDGSVVGIFELEQHV